MNKPSSPDLDPRLAGTARLPVVVPAAVVGFFYAAVFEYSLPLYFGAVAEAGRTDYPKNAWSMLWKYQLIPFAFAPILAGLLARRYGERTVWAGALLGKVLIPPLLVLQPSLNVLMGLAVWQGLTGALLWIAGLSLAQMVTPEKKGLANALMLMALGLGSLIGPFVGRFLLYREELTHLLLEGAWGEFALRFLNLAKMQGTPKIADFNVVFWLLAFTTMASSVAVGVWGQRPGVFGSDRAAPRWNEVFSDLGRLVRIKKFWVLVFTLCVLAQPLIQASNQFLPYRADVLGLKDGTRDEGWIWLNLLKTLMWLPGGAAVALLAGRRAGASVAVAIIGLFCLATFGMGVSHKPWHLFASVAVFEFVRQFIRWVFSGYIAEHMPDDLRSTSLGLSVTFGGASGVIFTWLADYWWSPALEASRPYSAPFYTAVVLGALGAILLVVYDRFTPIRDPSADPR